MKDILKQIEKAGLIGRGGAAFPVHLKWQFVKKATGAPKYVICNASEGETGLFKDIFILDHSADMVFKGLKIAMDFLNTKYAYINFNRSYYKQTQHKIDKLVAEYAKNGYDIQIFNEHPSYIGGEETALLNAIEGKRTEPRLKPPYPADHGLFGKPTLVHNVETLFNIARVAEGTFENRRFYCVYGEAKSPGVYHLPTDWSIEKVLKHTNNLPNFDFFVQVGGGASGIIYNQNQIKKELATGAGSIEIYKKSAKPHDVLARWFEFYDQQSCGKCTPCREGTYQLNKLLKENKQIPWKKIDEIMQVLETSSFCALGKSLPIPVRSYLKNVLKKKI